MSSTRADLAAVVVQSNDSSAAAPNLDENLICFSSLLALLAPFFGSKKMVVFLDPNPYQKGPCPTGAVRIAVSL